MFMKTMSWISILAVCTTGFLAAQTTNVNVPAKVLESYVGQYELTPGFALIIRKEGDRLTGQATGQPQLRLTARSRVDFDVAGVNASLTFETNKDGKVDHLVLHQNGDHDAQKISDTVPKDRVAIKVPPKTYDAYVGQYELAPGSIMSIRRDDDKLRAQLTGQPYFEVFPESETNFFYKVVDAQLTFVRDASGKVTELVLHQNGDKTARKISDEVTPIKGPDLSKIPPRDPKTPPQLLDLTDKYYSPLTEQWHPNVSGLPEGGNHLGSLPRGVQKLGGVDFDVRGVIQLTGTQAELAGAAFPDAQNGIKVGRKCKRLHFLQAAGWRTEDGTTIGKYVLHYAGGETATLNVVYGMDTRDWWATDAEAKDVKSASVAWSGSNPAAEAVGGSIRLFKRTYDNPKPDLKIETLDFVSAKADSAPFLVAVTLED
jgi:Domain of unknown function (DUF3471)